MGDFRGVLFLIRKPGVGDPVCSVDVATSPISGGPRCSYSDSLGVMSRVAGLVLLMAAVGGFFWAFKLLVDRPGSLVGILFFVPVWFAAVAGVKLVSGQTEDD